MGTSRLDGHGTGAEDHEGGRNHKPTPNQGVNQYRKASQTTNQSIGTDPTS
jgi:hypothetical protein